VNLKERINKEQFLEALKEGRKDFSNIIFELAMDLRQDIPDGKNTARGLLEGLNFSNAILVYVNFAFIEFRNCIFDSADLYKTNFESAVFDHCSFAGRSLRYAHIKHAIFKTN